MKFLRQIMQKSHARLFKISTAHDNNATKIGLYFIKKSISDRLKAGERLSADEITLWEYKDLGPNNRQRVRENDPESLIACDLLLGETS